MGLKLIPTSRNLTFIVIGWIIGLLTISVPFLYSHHNTTVYTADSDITAGKTFIPAGTELIHDSSFSEGFEQLSLYINVDQITLERNFSMRRDPESFLVIPYWVRTEGIKANELLDIDKMQKQKSDIEFSGDLRNTLMHMSSEGQEKAGRMIVDLRKYAHGISKELYEFFLMYERLPEKEKIIQYPEVYKKEYPELFKEYKHHEESILRLLEKKLEMNHDAIQIHITYDPFVYMLSVNKVIRGMTLGTPLPKPLKVEHLRGQVGFFLEKITEPIHAFDDYMMEQYYASEKGYELGVSVPVVYQRGDEFFYVCDLRIVSYRIES